MDTDLQNYIESKTLDLLEEVYGQLNKIYPPIDVNQILKTYGLKVYEASFDKEDILGIYHKSTKKVFIKTGISSKLSKLIAAKLLSHYFLHPDVEEDILTESDLKENEDKMIDQDIESEKFAESLLMPEFLTKRIWNQFSSIKDISRIFNLPHTTVYKRLSNLHLIKE